MAAGGAADAADDEKLAKALKAMTGFANSYCKNTGTTYCSDPSIPAVVIKGLAEHKVVLGAPLCPCRHYEDKAAEAKDGYWNCPCVPMRERHECHCMLFLTEENEFAGDSQKLSVEEARRRRADWAGRRGWAFRDARERAHTPPPPSACARRWRGVVPPAFGALTALTSAAPRAPVAARRWSRTQRAWARYCDGESAPLLGSLPPRALTWRSPWLSAVRGCPRALAREGLRLCDPSPEVPRAYSNRRTAVESPRDAACVLL